METSPSRLLGYSEVRQVSSLVGKAVILVQKYGYSQRRAAEVMGVSRPAISRALAAINEGRPTGCVGRPTKLTEEQSAELQVSVEKSIKEHRSPTKPALAQTVSTTFRS